jgi:hypothetical protein
MYIYKIIIFIVQNFIVAAFMKSITLKSEKVGGDGTG